MNEQASRFGFESVDPGLAFGTHAAHALYRQLASRLHPDVNGTGDESAFKVLGWCKRMLNA